MNCPKCNAECMDGSTLCGKCGAILIEKPESFQQDHVETLTQDQQFVQPEQPIQQPNDMSQAQQLTQESVSSLQTQQNEQLPTNSDNKTKKKINKKMIIIGVTAMVVILSAGLIMKHFLDKKNIDEKINSLFDPNSPIRVKKDEKYGFIDTNGNFIIQPQYKYATQFYGDYAEAVIQTEDDYGNKSSIYHVIDKKGNSRLQVDYEGDIKHIDDEDIWIINNQLYDSSLRKISKEGIKVEYREYGYLKWTDKDANNGGIMDSSGKITYTYNFSQGDSSLWVNPSEPVRLIKERYCVVAVEGRNGIVNCDTGAIAYDFTDETIYPESANIFIIHSKDNYAIATKMYIQNDKVVYQITDEGTRISYEDSGYIKISNYGKNGYQYSYVDISTGQVTDQRPNTDDVNIDEWEEYTHMTKFSCNPGYGLMNGDKIKVPCDWSDIKYLDLTLYKYLSSNGKNYVIARKDGKKYLLNIENGETVFEFNPDYYTTFEKNSTFAYERDESGNIHIYNLLTGKTTTFDADGLELKMYSNYCTLRKKDKTEYYNNNLTLIYTEEITD